MVERITSLFHRLSGAFPLVGDRPLLEDEARASYAPHGVSFTDYLPWVDYDEETGVFLLDDNVNVGAVFELAPVDIDGMPDDVIAEYERHLVNALHAIPADPEYPWILQFYIQDEPVDERQIVTWLREYADQRARDTRLTRAWLETLERFYRQARKGVFREPGTGKTWRALTRTVRICIYRNAPRSHYFDKKGRPRAGAVAPAAELEQACEGFLHVLRQAGFGVRQMDGEAFYRWILPWLSPNPAGYDDVRDYLDDHPWPPREQRTLAFDIGQAVVTNPPSLMKSERPESFGIYEFCGQLQRFISLQGIEQEPNPAALTGDQRLGNKRAASIWDRLPEDCIYAATIVARPQEKLVDHAQEILAKTGSATYEQDLVVQQADDYLKNQVFGDRGYSVLSGIYVRAPDMETMHRRTRTAISAVSQGFSPIDPRDDPISDKMFLHMLPMSYSFAFDQQKALRSRLAYTRHIARILPVYGRGRGSGNPGCLWANRAGEIFAIDPYSKKDRKKTAHQLLFGPTGSGKSATLVFNALHGMAMRRPRQFFIEKGKSFSLLAQYYKAHGLTTSSVIFTTRANISLPPYAMAKQALEQVEENRNRPDPEGLVSMEALEDEDYDDDEQRDYLGEMELLTQLMITGAQESEYRKMSRQDQFVIQRAIIQALEQSRREGTPHPIVSDVVRELEQISRLEESEMRRDRVMEMAQSLRLWTQGLRGQYFNRYGEAWPEVDATFIDMGILTQDQNKDMLAVALVSLVNAITGIGEKYQYDPRETEVIGDEWHVIAKNPVLIKPFVFGVKTWRKLGVWLTQATQNLDDYPDEAAVMLNLAEWWICLVMPTKEIADLSRFRRLSKEEQELLESASKEPGKYIEGVVMSDTVTSLFRVVMPGLALALAQTDNDEKVRRREIMREHDVSELEAAMMIANEIDEARARVVKA